MKDRSADTSQECWSALARISVQGLRRGYRVMQGEAAHRIGTGRPTEEYVYRPCPHLKLTLACADHVRNIALQLARLRQNELNVTSLGPEFNWG